MIIIPETETTHISKGIVLIYIISSTYQELSVCQLQFELLTIMLMI